jgi:hypothetical protein
MSPGIRRIAVVTLVSASAALALAGCADSQPTTPQVGTTSSPPVVVRPVNTAGQTPQQYAESQAPAMLQAFTPPPGARQVSVSPSGGLDFVEASTTDIDKNLVDQFTEWVAPGKPADVLALMARHVPAKYGFIGTGISGRGTNSSPVLDDVFQLPPIPRVLNLRELDVTVVLAGDDVTGKPLTGIRVDALVGWVTAGPAYQWIPTAARVMTLEEIPPSRQLNPASSSTGPPPAPATITNATQVRDIVSVINSLSPIPAGAVYSCPADFGGDVTLTFRARVGGPVLAAVSLPLSGCAFVEPMVNGKPEASLVPGDSATDVLWRIGRITGLDWAVVQE